jgi:hypothetical protein
VMGGIIWKGLFNDACVVLPIRYVSFHMDGGRILGIKYGLTALNMMFLVSLPFKTLTYICRILDIPYVYYY